ncbi:Crp/Fnr family transcriptional regulator [Planococcus antarcticus DSM 14505]|uniref:Crp/Fnr family transcriptional regulator n=1 Tax=Planococcus antarcticus DSM 14505 TaxID=1185653 RepID=A0ABN4RGG7_9BACL|nr:Crp/Fnr family transcriptional regulator [Planococcus antarcticus]ANU11092.1 Crp/Fnr family transcriptional regulator [Planococcus antarcticus DSM 14505]
MDQAIHNFLRRYELADIFPERLRHSMHIEKLSSGERLLSQGDDSDTLYLLVEGKLKVSMLSPEGKRLILAFKSPFDLVGDIEYVQHCPLINTVEAVTNTRVIRIPYHVLRKEMGDNAVWLEFLLKTITRKFEMKSYAMNFNLLYPVDVRLASYLLSMTPTQPKLDATSLVDMADLIGTSYRHLNRILLQFQKAGWITKKRGRITILDRASLLAQAVQNIYE